MSYDDQQMLTPAEVGELHGVDPKTVTRWARANRIISTVTPGGHRRFPSAQFATLIEARRRAQEAGKKS